MKKSGKKLKYITKVLSLLSAASLMLSQVAFAGEVLPLPGIVEEEQMIIEEENGTDISYSDEEGNIITPHVELVRGTSTAYPSVFDLRNVGGTSYVTRPECQYCADCWTYASISSLESNALMQGLGEQHFSKSHLCYFSLTPQVEGIKASSPFSFGGNTDYVVGALSNLEGLANKSDYPNAQDTDVTYAESDRFNRESGFILDEAVTISDTDEMKDWLMNNGALYASVYQLNYTDSIPTYMYSTPQSTNHGITIIGWDDSVPKEKFTHTEAVTDSDGNTTTQEVTPAVDGAWIVKNSVGLYENGVKQEYYDNNYMYLSYSQYIGSCVGFKVQEDPGILNNYTYSERNVYNYFYGTSIKYADVFTAENNEAINQVGFEINDHNSKYPANKLTDVTVTVQIYKNLSSSYENSSNQFNPASSGTLAGTYSQHYYQAGYYTFDIPSEITVSKGEIYSVVISMTDSEGCYLDVPVEYYVSGSSYYYTAEKGQSFYSTSAASGSYMSDLYTRYGNTDTARSCNVFMHVYTTCVHSEAVKEENETKVVYCTQCGKTLRTLCEHVYDDGVTTPATCQAEGKTVYTCTKCGEKKTVVIKKPDHTIVTDKGYAATCTTDGLTDGTHCSVCGQVLKAQTVIKAPGHTNKATVRENVVSETCTKPGSYDSVIYCSVCGEEVSRVKITVSALGHTNKAAVKENEIAATCTGSGSYDSVIYCSVCGEEVSRVKITVSALGHTNKAAVKENEIAATCTGSGSYDSVIYCSVCGEEVSRNKITVPALGHTSYVSKKGTARTCTQDGTTDEIRCSVCGVLIQAQTVIPAGHTDTESDGVCDVCGVVFNQALNNQYKLDRSVLSAPSDAKVDYKNKVKFTVSASGLPEGYTVVLYENGSKKASDSSSITYTSGELTGRTDYTVSVVSPDGTAVKTRSFAVNVNAGFFQKLIAFFRGLFGSQPTKGI